MEFEELVKFRRSSRWMFSKKPIPDFELKKILEAARFAPTPHNSQPFEIIVVKLQSSCIPLIVTSKSFTRFFSSKYLDVIMLDIFTDRVVMISFLSISLISISTGILTVQ